MSSLLQRLANDYPQFQFVQSDRARWSASEQTIYYTGDQLQTLHELGHALLGHNTYRQDVELIQIERAAWVKAQQLAPQYGLSINDDTVEEALDSYRDWLHSRSKCPRCHQTGWQDSHDLTYHCPNCQCVWRASDGRQARMRRIKAK